MTKLKITKPKLSTILRAAFLIIMISEIAILYKYFYLSLSTRGGVQHSEEQKPVLKISEDSTQKLKTWLKLRENFILTPYNLQQGEFGRENPFAEYQ